MHHAPTDRQGHSCRSQAPVPECYRGVWRRTILEQAGLRDAESLVMWLQTGCWHGDLRIPPGRPDFGQLHDLQQCSREHLQWLLRQEGFVGTTYVDGNLCEWQRLFDYHPTGRRDVARMVCRDHFIEEYGVWQEYFERWERQPISPTGYAAQRTGSVERTRIRLRAGQYFFYCRPRNIDPAAAERYWQDVRAGHATDDAMRLLADFELSFGVVETGQWRILHSSHPWREGCLLSQEGDWVKLDTGTDEGDIS